MKVLIIEDDKKIVSFLAVANLVDNAMKYSASGSAVTLSAKSTNNKLVIQVRDEGKSLAESEQERIWERLYRVDRSRSEPGLGLGLAMVRAIAEAHGGHASVESRFDRDRRSRRSKNGRGRPSA